MLHVALFEPEIAPNTGSVARTCLAAGASLHLIRPLGFRLSDRKLARAGMDYWDRVDPTVHASYEAFRAAFAHAYGTGRVFGFTTRGERTHWETAFVDGAVLLFGPESRGLPDAVLGEVAPVRIPMQPGARSLNVAVAVGVALFEATRSSKGQ